MINLNNWHTKRSIIYTALWVFILSMCIHVDLFSQQLNQESKTCIDRIISGDSEYGTIRNHDPEEMPISQAIVNYVRNIRSMDYSNCPEDFSSLFNAHILAWEELIPLTEKHLELRGEMHDVFNEIEKSGDADQFNQGVKKIWETWGELEEWMKQHEE